MFKKIYGRLLLLGYLLGMYFFAEKFSFMVLNVFLAWLPFELGNLFLRLEKRAGWILPFWLLFFPNIPYLLTDLFHLRALDIYRRDGLFVATMPDWWYFVLLVVPIFVMVTLGMQQVWRLLEKLSLRKNYEGYFCLLALSFLSSLGIYVGRFDRLHSVALILHPIETVLDLLGNWSGQKVQFILLFSILQLILLLFLRDNKFFSEKK